MNNDLTNTNIINKPLMFVHMTNDLNLFDKKILNILIRQAYLIENINKIGKYTSIPNQSYFEFSFDLVEEWLCIDKYHQRKEIVKSLKKLVNTSLEFNIFKRDKKNHDIVFSTILSGVMFKNSFDQKEEAEGDKIQNSKIYFAFSQFFTDLILNPTLYAKLSLEELNKISSKHTLALWEYLQTELNISNQNEIKSQILQITEYKKLIAGNESEYKEFKKINANLVKKPLKEICEKTSINAEAIFHKTGRLTTGIQFQVSYKNNNLQFGQETQSQDVINRNESITLLKKYTSNDKIIQDILSKYPNCDYIIKNISVIESSSKANIRLVRAALRDNYAKINIMQQELDLFGKKDEIELSRNTDLENEIKEEMIKKPNFNNIINDKLINLNIGEKKRKEFMEKYTETHILENIEYSFKYAEDRKTKIGAPLIIKAIEENWANSGPEKELLKEKERFLIELWSILYSYEGIKKEAEFCYQHTYIGTTIYLYNQISRATEEDFNNHRRFNEVRKQFKTLAEFQEAVKRHTKLELDAIENKLKNAKEKYNLSLDDLCKIKGYTKQDVFTKMEVSEDEFLRLKESLL